MATPKTTSTTTIVRKGKGRGKKTSTVNVLDTTPETGEYFIEMEEDDLENSDSDAIELYEIFRKHEWSRGRNRDELGARDGTTNLTP